MPRESCAAGSKWRVGPLKFVAKLKHRLSKKVDDYFINYYFPGDGTSAPPPQPWSGGEFPYHNVEASSSNHTSAPNSQYFDAADTGEYLQQHQINPDYNLLGDFETPMSVDEYADFSDALMEIQQQQDLSHLHQHSEQFYYPAPSYATSTHEMSTDTVETDTTDTGNSNFRGTFPSGAYICQPQPVHAPHLTVFGEYARRVADILLGDDDDQSLRSRFRVVASIVYAYRKFKTLLQRRRSRSTPPSIMIPASPCRFRAIVSPHASRLYLGVKQRKGKWVAEIRVSRMPDKVWLGSFPLEKQAALAYDAGLHHCSVKRNKVFNFRESPQRLGPSLYAELLVMDKEDRKVAVQKMASHYAIKYGGS